MISCKFACKSPSFLPLAWTRMLFTLDHLCFWTNSCISSRWTDLIATSLSSGAWPHLGWGFRCAKTPSRTSPWRPEERSMLVDVVGSLQTELQTSLNGCEAIYRVVDNVKIQANASSFSEMRRLDTKWHHSWFTVPFSSWRSDHVHLGL